MTEKVFEIEQIKRRKVGERIEAMKSAGQAMGSKFRYAYSKNLKMLTDEIETYQDIVKPSEQFSEFQKKLTDLRIEHAKKDEKTNAPVSEKNSRGEENYVFADAKKYNSEYEKLKAEYKPVIEEREAQIKNFDSFLDEYVSFAFHKVSDADVPETLTAEEYSSVFFMIAEPGEKENVVPIKKEEPAQRIEKDV